MKELVFESMIAIIASIMGVSCGTAHDAAPADTNKPIPDLVVDSQKPEVKPVEVVSSTPAHPRLGVADVLRDYEQNEIAADQLYKGKRLHLLQRGARIESIGRDILGKPYITFHSSNFRSVQAFFKSDSAVARFQVGDLVTDIDGICKGLMLNVILEDSHISGTVYR
jgi:hypothetical protein